MLGPTLTLVAIVVSAGMTAPAGVFYAFYYNNLFPEQTFFIHCMNRKPNGHLVCLSMNGQLREVDRQGKELFTVTLTQTGGNWSGVEGLPNNRYLCVELTGGHVFEVRRRVQGLHVQPFGRVPHQVLDGRALSLLLREALPVRDEWLVLGCVHGSASTLLAR